MNQAIINLVRQLTPAQRDWVKHGWRSDGRGYWPVRNALVRLGLVDAHHGNSLTAIGRTAQAVIKGIDKPRQCQPVPGVYGPDQHAAGFVAKEVE